MIKHAICHARLLESFQGHRMSETVQAELNEFAALSYTKLTDAAFARAETPEDIRDLLYPFLGGANVSYEPVIGSLSGFERRSTAAPCAGSGWRSRGGSPTRVGSSACGTRPSALPRPSARCSRRLHPRQATSRPSCVRMVRACGAGSEDQAHRTDQR
jgi:hypothetical protein